MCFIINGGKRGYDRVVMLGDQSTEVTLLKECERTSASIMLNRKCWGRKGCGDAFGRLIRVMASRLKVWVFGNKLCLNEVWV